MAISRYFPYPFAVDADDLTAIPNSSAIDGSVSYQDGWTPPYEQNLLTDPSALPIPRGQMNQLFYDITLNIKEYQEYGAPQWVVGNTVQYPVNAVVYYGGNTYQNQVADNTATPNTDSSWLRINVTDINPISTSTVLTQNMFNRLIYCFGSSSYTVTLPSVTSNAGKVIKFFCITSSFGLVTLSPASGTIQGKSSFVLGTGESCTLYCDGTDWWLQNYYMQPISFLVNLSVGQSIASNVNTRVNFDTAQFNSNNFFNVSTNRFQPLYPGLYSFYFASQFVGPFADPNVIVSNLIYKTGSLISELSNNSVSGTSPMTTYSRIDAYFNGSSDYLEFWINQNDINPATLSSNSVFTYAGATRISPF